MEWIKIEDKDPPDSEDVLVVKHYLNQNFCTESGGYRGDWFDTDRFITIDSYWSDKRWFHGGIITHWMPLPKMPEKINE